jgi:hypothetical protein
MIMCIMFKFLLIAHIIIDMFLTITNATGKEIHSSDQNGFQMSGATSYVMTYILSFTTVLKSLINSTGDEIVI